MQVPSFISWCNNKLYNQFNNWMNEHDDDKDDDDKEYNEIRRH